MSVDFSPEINNFMNAELGEAVRGSLVDIAEALETAINSQLITVDPTLTESGQGADAAITGEEIDNLADGIDTICLKDIINTNTWTVGSLAAQTGGPFESTNRLRTNNFISVSDGVFVINVNQGYEFLVYAYSSGGTYIGCLKDLKVFDTTLENYKWVNSYALYEHPDYKYKFVLRKLDGTDMQESDGDNCLYGIHWAANAAATPQMMGVLKNNTDLNNINYNSIYILDSTRTYLNGPESPLSGFFRTEVIGNNIQQMICRFASTFENGAGKIWYRNALNQSFRAWGRINITEPEMAALKNDCIVTMNYDGTETSPKSIFANRSPLHYASFIALSWITETINNISYASSILNFGSKSETNAATIGVERATLRLFVASPANNSGANLYAFGNEQSATVKLTSFSKTLYMFGDSITWGRNGDKASSAEEGFRCQNTFSSVIQRNLGITAINYGIGDQGWLATGSNDRTAYQEIINHNIVNGDYFTLAWGVNDRSHIMTDGSFDADKLGAYTDTSGTSLMAEVYKCVNRLYEVKPQCHVILIAPWNGRNVGSFPAYKFADTTYAALIAELKKFADYYYLPWIGNDCPLNGWGMKSGALMGNDGVHPCAKGYEFIGNWMSGELSKIIG